MSSAFEIPLSARAQTFSISILGTVYVFLLRWNDPGLCWVLDIADSNNNALANGIPLVTGVNLLGQLGYLGINGQLIVQTDHNVNAVPTFANLGTLGHLYFIPD